MKQIILLYWPLPDKNSFRKEISSFVEVRILKDNLVCTWKNRKNLLQTFHLDVVLDVVFPGRFNSFSLGPDLGSVGGRIYSFGKQFSGYISAAALVCPAENINKTSSQETILQYSIRPTHKGTFYKTPEKKLGVTLEFSFIPKTVLFAWNSFRVAVITI